MVTVGDKIAWWALDHMPRQRINTNPNTTTGSTVRMRKTSYGTYGSRRDPFKRRSRQGSESGTSPGEFIVYRVLNKLSH